MGFEVERFQGDVDEEFICPICSGVLEDPLQATACEHAFCRACITEWISRQEPTCPVDRRPVTASQLRPVPRIIRNVLSRLCTSCDNAPHGCNAVLQLDSLASHLVECEFNPRRPMPCEAGCGLVIPKDELAEHNCVRELRALIATHQGKMNDYEKELATHQGKLNDYEKELAEHKRMHQGKLEAYEQQLAEHKRAHQGKLNDYEQELAEHKRELALLKEFMREMRLSNPSSMRALADQMEREEVLRWANSLPRAKVTNWGARIMSPRDDVQMKIKGSLSESGCPPHIIDDLMKNCHSERWPAGLSLRETTENNIRLYKKYVCKRVPGRQAVLVLQCDNTHMGELMMVKPGFVLIFLQGIE